jgi:hypothetical protein
MVDEPSQQPSGKAQPSKSQNQTDARGRFLPGNKMSRGRPHGSRNRATLMIDALTFKNLKPIANVLVEKARAGEPWAVTLVTKGMLPRRAKSIDEPVERGAPVNTEEATQRVAEALQRLEAGSLGFDEARAVAEMAQAYVAVKNVAGLEQRSAEMLAEIESLRAEIARLTGGSR